MKNRYLQLTKASWTAAQEKGQSYRLSLFQAILSLKDLFVKRFLSGL